MGLSPFFDLATMSDKSELAIVYASLILASGGLEVTAERLESVVKSANVEVESYWYSLFAKALEGKDVNELVSNAGSAAPSSAGAAAAGGAAGDAAAPAAEEKKEESEDESSEEMGLGMFD